MLRFARWVSYRDKVLVDLGALLVMYPRGRQFTADFPGLLASIERHFAGGVSPAGSALQLAATIIVDLLRQLVPQQRAATLQKLQALDASELQALAAQQLSGRAPACADPADFAAHLAGVALLMAHRMLRDATLGQREYEFLVAEIYGALGAEARRGATAGSRRGPDLE